jgi:spermidine/putrescine transport system ATP-binding protein
MQSVREFATLDEPGPEPEPESTSGPAVECFHIVRRFGGVTALDGVSLSVERGEFFCLLGPSGCGKTTLLRIVAGLEKPDQGRVRLAGRDVTSTPPQHRPVNMVFQSYALFPHLSVWDNVAFGPRMRRLPENRIAEKVADVLARVRIEDLAHRRPHQLSGGQQQRVALARALVNEPEVLLLDEPLGALDLQLRRQLQAELRQVQRRLGLTFIHVTHDQEEALALSDRIAVMNRGRIEQVGPPREVYERPRTRFVAEFLGNCNLLEAGIVAVGGDQLRIQTASGFLCMPRPHGASEAAPGRTVTLAVRPERIQLFRPDRAPAHTNGWLGQVEETIFRGSTTEYRIRCGPQQLRALQAPNGAAHGPFAVGDTVVCHLPPEFLNLLED